MFNKRLFFLCFICFLYASCSFITWERLTVSCSVTESQTHVTDDFIVLRFSIEPDELKLKEIIQFKKNGKNIEFEMSKKASSFFLRPVTPWEYDVPYQISVNDSVLMSDGRSYTVHLQRNFIYGVPGNKLSLVKTEPSDISAIASDCPLIFYFNKAVSVKSFLEKFSISPSVDKHIDFSQGNAVVTVFPKAKWKLNTLYKWSFDGILAADGYRLDRQYEGRFSSIRDTEIPRLLTVCPVTDDGSVPVWQEALPLDANLLENQCIGFIFSKPIDGNSLNAGISFTPTMSGYITVSESDPCRAVWHPSELWKLKERYQLLIPTSVTDTSGLSLFEDVTYFFSTFNTYLRVDKISFDSVLNITEFPAENIAHTLQRVGSGTVLTVHVLFSSVIDSAHRKKVVDSVRMSAFFPATAANPVLESVVWNPEGTGVSFVWNGFTVSSGAITDYYKLTVSGGSSGIQNEAGEYMERDVCVIFSAL